MAAFVRQSWPKFYILISTILVTLQFYFGYSSVYYKESWYENGFLGTVRVSKLNRASNYQKCSKCIFWFYWGYVYCSLCWNKKVDLKIVFSKHWVQRIVTLNNNRASSCILVILQFMLQQECFCWFEALVHRKPFSNGFLWTNIFDIIQSQ